MVDLVLGGAGEQASALENNFLSLEVLGADGDFCRAADIGIDFRDAEAPFRGDLFTFGVANLRIDEHQRHQCFQLLGFAVDEQLRRPVGDVADIDDGEQEGPADLLRGQPEAFGGVHGLEHVGGELANLSRDAFDPLTLFAQRRVAVFDDVQYHDSSIAAGARGVKAEADFGRDGGACPRNPSCARNRAKEVRFVPLEGYYVKLVELIVAPFRDFGAVWLGIVPLYVSLLLGELYKSKVSFSHAVGNGFVMLWTGLNWTMHLSNLGFFAYLGDVKSRTAIAWLVAVCAVGLGIFTIVLGLRKKDRTLCQILGHTRFSNYFLITLYPMQVGLIRWNWPSLSAVLVFALPAWLFIYLVGRLLKVVIK